MTVVGITGPTGAGKTTALEVLAELSFEIVDCDALYYRLLRDDGQLRRKMEEAFGQVFCRTAAWTVGRWQNGCLPIRRSWRS